MSFSGDVPVSFVDPKDPFLESGAPEELRLGPALSILDARRFDSVCLFQTPHTRANAGALAAGIGARHAGCETSVRGLPGSSGAPAAAVCLPLTPLEGSHVLFQAGGVFEDRRHRPRGGVHCHALRLQSLAPGRRPPLRSLAPVRARRPLPARPRNTDQPGQRTPRPAPSRVLPAANARRATGRCGGSPRPAFSCGRGASLPSRRCRSLRNGETRRGGRARSRAARL